MTSDLKAARAALVSLLNGVSGVRAVSVVPKTFTPPIVWVTARQPYRQRAQAVGRKRINLAAVCVGGMSTNDAAADAADDLAELVADAIDRSTTFLLDPGAEMDQPMAYQTAMGQDMVGIAVNIICESVRG
jgi:hypothetical protein